MSAIQKMDETQTFNLSKGTVAVEVLIGRDGSYEQWDRVSERSGAMALCASAPPIPGYGRGSSRGENFLLNVSFGEKTAASYFCCSQKGNVWTNP